MSDRLLRHIPTNILYVWQPAFANNPEFEEIIDVESRVIPDEPEAAAPAPIATEEPDNG